jgi:hypothetical protein
MIGENDLGDRRREMVYPPQPEPRITTRSCLLSDLVVAGECSTYVARHLCPDMVFKETLLKEGQSEWPIRDGRRLKARANGRGGILS